MKIRLTEEIWKEGNMFISYCPELDIPSCGESVEQAKKNLKEVILINIQETKKMGIFDRFLQEAGFEDIQKVLCINFPVRYDLLLFQNTKKFLYLLS